MSKDDLLRDLARRVTAHEALLAEILRQITPCCDVCGAPASTRHLDRLAKPSARIVHRCANCAPPACGDLLP